MINRTEEDDNLDDLDYVKRIEAVQKFMNFGVSGSYDTQEKILHFKCLQNKIVESQDKVEDQMNIIETIADNQPPKRKRGALFERIETKASRTSIKRRSILISFNIIKFLFYYFLINKHIF